MSLSSKYLIDSKARGYLYQCSDLEKLDTLMGERQVAAYCGFDATADSLHVGSLMQIMRLRHLQKMGHKPIVLVGGGTTKVGDPSGKDQSRSMLSQSQIQQNINGILKILKRFISFGEGKTDALLVNNDDWLKDLNYLEFLRDFGPHFSINRMLGFESVKMRLQREQNLSFLEFNYMILQAYDFLHLHQKHDCLLQMGGADQWGNIIAGVELVRRVKGSEVYALTCPLITTADGKKMGKTASGAVWLDSDKVSVFDFWQFWRNTHDDDVIRFLKFFTDLELSEIKQFEGLQGQDLNEVKVLLADHVTSIVHGTQATDKVKAAGGGGGDLSGLPVIEVDLAQGAQSAVDILVLSTLCQSKSEAKRLIQGNGARINDQIVTDAAQMFNELQDQGQLKISAGKKRHVLLKCK